MQVGKYCSAVYSPKLSFGNSEKTKTENAAADGKSETFAKCPGYIDLVVVKPLHKELKEFDASTLPHRTIQEEFDSDELVQPKDMNLSSTFDLAGVYGSEIKYFDANEDIVPWRKEQLFDKYRYETGSDEEAQKEVEAYTEKFKTDIENLKKDSKENIDKITPCSKEHKVYRTISRSPFDDYGYFDKMKNLKKDEEFVISSIPTYVSTSAKYVMSTYGGFNRECILFDINLPKGSKIAPLPSSDGINQCLMKPDSKFKVLDNQEYKNGFRVINLEYKPEEA